MFEVTQVVNLYIHERREGDVAVLDLKGRIRIHEDFLKQEKTWK